MDAVNGGMIGGVIGDVIGCMIGAISVCDDQAAAK